MSETALRPAKTVPIPFLPGAARDDRCVEHRQWRAAWDQVTAATGTIPSLTLVLGPAGTGKTLLLRRLAQHLITTGAEVLVQSRGDLPPEPAGPPGSQARRIVLIDEADRMDAAAMQQLAQLGACAVVLAGLAGPGSAGAAYATAVVTLAPLPAGEIRAFVAERLAQSGLPQDLFDETAVACVAARSGGVPRLLTSLMSAAVFIAGGEGARRVSGRHVDAAAGFRDGSSEQPGSSAPGLGAPGLGAPGLGAPGLGAPGLGARGLGAPQSEADAALAAAESRLVDSDEAWASAQDEYLQSLAAERRQSLRRGAVACTVAAIGALGGWLWFERAGHDGPHLSATLAERAPASLAPPAPAASPVPPRPAPGTAATGLTATPGSASMTPAPPAALEFRASAPDAVRPLPQDAPIRVTLRYGLADADAAVRTSALARSLRAAGFMVDSQPVSRQAAAEPGARYFFAEDRHAAETVMQAAGLPGQAALVKTAPSAGLPPPGSIELMVPHSAAREPPAAAGHPTDHQRN